MEKALDFLRQVFLFKENSPLLFTQFYFWAFFAIVFALFSLIHRRRLLRNAFLFFVSLFFYYKTSGLFVLILLFVTCSDFFIAKRIHAAQSKGGRKAWLVLSICIDLGLLCYFKYAYFFTDLVNNLFHCQLRVFDIFSQVGNILCGSEVFNVDRIVLPVGISFFTFQVISYTVDVYRCKVKPVHNILDFGFYVSFFPQLVAGPIVRAEEFIPQLYKPYFLSRRQFGMAVFWIVNGLAKKIILSDYLAVNFIDRVFDNPLLFSGFENLMALFCYSLQVYADFSGYTDIAIGVAMLMGFYLPKNFNSPYKAPNPSNFWKRWHMSLSRWLQNYLYIPLGGNRNTTFGTFFWLGLISLIVLFLSGSLVTSLVVLALAVLVAFRIKFSKPSQRKLLVGNLNSFVTMLLGGLWHGASWNFMIWGGLNGVGMIVYKFWKNMSWHMRFALVTLCTLTLYILTQKDPRPVWNVFFVWMSIIFAVTSVRYAWHFAERALWRREERFVKRLEEERENNISPSQAQKTEQSQAAAEGSLPNGGSAFVKSSGQTAAGKGINSAVARADGAASGKEASGNLPRLSRAATEEGQNSKRRKKSGREQRFAWAGRAWAVAQTFTFITFTRLFFRSGSNLDPATANRQAWQTASSMITQIGSAWGGVNVWDVACAYKNVFSLFVIGMIIHWLPERWKRCYRLRFALLPLPLMAVCVALVVFVVYQFITSDLQAFIYFQF